MSFHKIVLLAACVGFGAVFGATRLDNTASTDELRLPMHDSFAEVLWTRPICIETNRYIGWPTVCRRASGELIAVFSGDRDWHVCPWGKVQIVRSTDNGETWSSPDTIINSVADDRDSGILELPDGTLVLKWFTSTAWMEKEWTERLVRRKEFSILDCYRQHFSKIEKSALRRDVGTFTARSTDGGRNWEPRVPTLGSAPHGGILLKDGRLLLVGRGRSGQEVKLFVEESTDSARSWQLIAEIGVPEGEDINRFCEPHTCECADGSIIAAFRHTIEPNEIRLARSIDGGRTWTKTERTGVFGLPPHLLALADGRIVMTYCKRLKDKYGEYAVISKDNGRTWDVANEVVLASHFNADLGYPSTVQLDGKKLFSVYYQAHTKGEKPCLMATRWRIK